LRIDEQEGLDEKDGRSTRIESQGLEARLKDKQEGSRTYRKARGRIGRIKEAQESNDKRKVKISRNCWKKVKAGDL
jgi:hypothetical protein